MGGRDRGLLRMYGGRSMHEEVADLRHAHTATSFGRACVSEECHGGSNASHAGRQASGWVGGWVHGTCSMHHTVQLPSAAPHLPRAMQGACGSTDASTAPRHPTITPPPQPQPALRLPCATPTPTTPPPQPAGRHTVLARQVAVVQQVRPPAARPPPRPWGHLRCSLLGTSACVRACVLACVRACLLVRACVRACASACAGCR